ncbi:MAG: hypothetical protein NWE88_01900 [Candidatus Bathyarchaeota archaeon]|nr:hypothetical protein [Candidatus Bathyarchaeota archaeon]
MAVGDSIKTYLIIGVFSVPFILKIIIKIQFWYIKRIRAHNDYDNARGTHHKKMIEKKLAKLKTDVDKTRNQLLSAQNTHKAIISERDLKLEKRITTIIFENEFTNIKGIGTVLRDRIRRQCFNGTLDSLRYSGSVQGIGEEKGYEIQQWISRTRRKLPQRLRGEFQGKQSIRNEYSKKIRDANRKINSITNEYNPKNRLQKTVELELDKLNIVKPSTFVTSYNGDQEASQIVTEYLLGSFPEWRTMPLWFKTLSENYP